MLSRPFPIPVACRWARLVRNPCSPPPCRDLGVLNYAPLSLLFHLCRRSLVQVALLVFPVDRLFLFHVAYFPLLSG